MDTQTKAIDGGMLLRMLGGGAELLSRHTEELNALNVFPVADGDTGTNMLRTMEGGLKSVAGYGGGAGASAGGSPIDIGEVAREFAGGVLLSARGNSGVILSQIFAGIGEGLSGLGSATARELAEAYRRGIERSYAAVRRPVEGTILTVFRESTEYALAGLSEDSDICNFFRLHIEEAHRSLEATRELLPVLTESDVVDSGAAGYLCIAEGMYRALCGEAGEYRPSAAVRETCADISLFTRKSTLREGYCTEFLLRLTDSKVDVDGFSIDTVTSRLDALGGESVVALLEGDILKVHVHTRTPGAVLGEMQAFGEFLTVKIENMDLGHSDSTARPVSAADAVGGADQDPTPPAAKPKIKKPYAVIAVASGDGMEALFYELGADRVIRGGQSLNPSAAEFARAFAECEAGDLIVLPNNKNIIMAARQAAELYTAARVHVLETRSMTEGYSALSVITPGIKDIDQLLGGAVNAARGVCDGEVTRAVRDAVIDGVQIHCGEWMALSRGKLAALSDDPEDALAALVEHLNADGLGELLTVFAGREVTDERRAVVTERLRRAYPELEVTVYCGGQDVYDYLAAIE